VDATSLGDPAVRVEALDASAPSSDQTPDSTSSPAPEPAPDPGVPGSRGERTAELLARAGETDDETERNRLLDEVVVLNMGVAEAVAARYRSRGIPQDDLQQVAYLALTKAVRRYDPASAGSDFLSYAVPTMRGEVRRYFRDQGWVVRPTRRIQELQAQVFAASEELSATLGRSPRPSEIAEHLDEPLGDVEEALATDGCFQPASLDRPVVSEGGTTTLGQLMGEEETGWSSVEARVALRPVVRRLDERDRRILQLRFFDGCTQSEIADDIGVTQMQVSRLLSRIMRDLRADLGELDDA
jgi:RNA polymerase sigma-B factor